LRKFWAFHFDTIGCLGRFQVRGHGQDELFGLANPIARQERVHSFGDLSGCECVTTALALHNQIRTVHLPGVQVYALLGLAVNTIEAAHLDRCPQTGQPKAQPLEIFGTH
jgi:hypothetical protein